MPHSAMIPSLFLSFEAQSLASSWKMSHADRTNAERWMNSWLIGLGGMKKRYS